MQISKKYHYLLLGISLLLISCNNKNLLPVPDIVNDSIILSGIIIDDRIDKEENSLTPEISLFNPISGTPSTYAITVDNEGKFKIELPVETNPTMVAIWFGSESSVFAWLIKEEDSFLEIRFDKEGNINANLSNSFQLSSYDMTEAANLFTKMELSPSPFHNSFYDKSFEEYTSAVNENMNYRISNALKEFPLISEPIKEFITQEFRLILQRSYMFSYSERILESYRNTNPEELWDSYIAPPEPDKSYYSFLKELNLNDKRNIYTESAYRSVLNSILLNDTLGIPEINDTPIDIWIKEAAKTLGELVGFKKGFFYEQLAIRSYTRQFEYQSKPLTEQQKQNIKNYFKNKAIPEILFRENEKIEKIAKSLDLPVINSTLNLPDEQVFETILSKYAGKLVFMDFWATWCKPCIEAINEIKELKSELHGKDIVFVYITNPSSSEKIWEHRTQGIGGEHYYLSESQWDYISDHFDFSGIPTYLLFDKNGALKKKITGYPGNDEMRTILTELMGF